jgi:sugar lactone lactonase YvrE
MKCRSLPLFSLILALSACDGDSLAGLNEPSVGSHRDGPAALKALIDASPRACQPPEVKPAFQFGVGAAEGVAVSRRGDVFVGNINTGEIWRAPQGDFGKASLLADLLAVSSPLSFLLGLDVTSTGVLYAGVNAFLDPSVHGVWRVLPDGTASRVAAAPAFFGSLLNDVAIDPKGNVYVSDSMGGAIWRLTPDGEFQIWVKSELLRGGVHPIFGIEFGVNGLAYHKGALYGGIHLNGRVIRLPIEPDGAAGAPAIAVDDAALIGNDGIELDPRGNIYVANNFANTVQRIRASDLSIETVVAEGLSAPASLAFSANHKVLYVANLSISAPSPKPYAPALVQAEFAVPVVAWRACGSID